MIESFNSLFELASPVDTYTPAEFMIWQASQAEPNTPSYVVLAKEGPGWVVCQRMEWALKYRVPGEIIVPIPRLTPECDGGSISDCVFDIAFEQFRVNLEIALEEDEQNKE